MDPNATLRELRDLVRDAENGEDVQDEIAERFAALDNWITRGGFLPAEWSTIPGND